MESQTNQPWQGKISHHAQIGGIETSVLDTGLGKGTRIAWINTGAGLRYKVLLDRCMDIADAFHNNYGLAWLSHVGVTYPQPFSNRGIEWLKTFGGGLLTTCGLDHVGGPETDAHGERGLHGPISNLPAEIESIIQPDPSAGKMNMSITGRIRQFEVGGLRLELKRTISGTLGKSSIIIEDEVVNHGNISAPHMLMYHFNFGWPMADKGANILWKGDWHPRDDHKVFHIFREGNDFHTCPDPREDHAGRGEEVAFIDITPDDRGECVCGIHNDRIGVAVAIRFRKNELPWLVNWQHWGKGEYVTGIEPSSSLPIGQAKVREMGQLIELAPGEKRNYRLTVETLDDKAHIAELIQQTHH